MEDEVKQRNKTCVYCGIGMLENMSPHGPRKAAATWEHIVNDARIVTRENIAWCCVACNSSKGTEDLSAWILSSYCKKRALRKLDYIENAEMISDLKTPPGNRLHELTGDRSGQFSISVNDQLRICFRFVDGDAFDVELIDYQ